MCLTYCSADIDGRMDEHLGNMGVSMDGRFNSIRTMETNLGETVDLSTSHLSHHLKWHLI